MVYRLEMRNRKREQLEKEKSDRRMQEEQRAHAEKEHYSGGLNTGQ
jgi:hypothetical protein